MLVDGYNVVGTWHDLKRARDHDGMEEARRLLIEALANYSAYHDFDTRLVFDAHFQDGSSKRDVITSNLAVHYTDFGQTADTFIEKTCAAFRHDIRKFHQRLIVATSDRAQELTVKGYGAEWMSSEQLGIEVDRALIKVRSKKKPATKNPRRFLGNLIDPDAHKKLSEMRRGKKN
jgi:predicted RNA-binding protein with PIN domain